MYLPRFSFRQSLAVLLSLRRNSCDNLSDHMLVMNLIEEWSGCGQLLVALYEIIGRARLGALCPALGESNPLYHIDGGAWYESRQRALLFANAVARYTRSHQKPSSFGELKKAVERVMDPDDFYQAYPRSFELGVLVPESASNYLTPTSR